MRIMRKFFFNLFSYEDFVKMKISKNNIDKVVKLRNIVKYNIMNDFDFATNNDVKRIKKETEDNLYLVMHRLGPPAFLKQRFKNETIKKYKIVNGTNFGN